MQVLVHTHYDLGPVGAWGWHHDTLRHYYPTQLDLAISGRARTLMAQRPADIDVPTWFAHIADARVDTHRLSLDARFDTYRLIDIDDGTTLLDVVREHRRTWQPPSRR